MRVVWSLVAVERMEEAVRYIARDDPRAARRWAKGLLDRIYRLEQFPESGRPVPELSRSDLRELIHHSHRVIYRLTAETVRVLTVRHCARVLDETELNDPDSAT